MASEKCDFIVSNTIVIDEHYRHIIGHDLHKRHGKYTYLYPSTFQLGTTVSISIVTESVAIMSSEPLAP